MRKYPPRRNRSEKGNAVIEFALAYLILGPLLLGLFQFGYSLFIYEQLAAAVRQAARYASISTYTSATTAPTDDFVTGVQNVAVFNNPSPAPGDASSIPNFTAANVNLAVTFESGVPSQVAVTVANYQMNALFGTMLLNRPSAVFPYTGRYAPPTQ
jgi:Flp pilus assembly protein TadG